LGGETDIRDAQAIYLKLVIFRLLVLAATSASWELRYA
jgi:hypothetical protein